MRLYKVEKERKRSMEKRNYVAHEQIGYFCKDYEMVGLYCLDSHKYAQCGIQDCGDSIVFYSYSSPILRVSPTQLYRSCKIEFFPVHVDYSRTTGKQVGWFCNECFCGLTYHELKKACNEDDTKPVYATMQEDIFRFFFEK